MAANAGDDNGAGSVNTTETSHVEERRHVSTRRIWYVVGAVAGVAVAIAMAALGTLL